MTPSAHTDTSFSLIADPDSTTGWMALGLCRMYAPVDVLPQRRRRRRQGAQDLRRLPGHGRCLEYALEHRIDHGVWGGCSERERRRILKRRRDRHAVELRRLSSASCRQLAGGGGGGKLAAWRWPRALVCAAGCAAGLSSFMPSARPSLNSFWALPRFLASFGSCEPPNTSNTMTRTMIDLAGSETSHARTLIRSLTARDRRPPNIPCQAPTMLRAACARWRRMRRRSRSLSPPQIPNFSPFWSANSRHSFAHDAAAAHLLRLAGGRPPFGKEQVGVDAEAVRIVLPVARRESLAPWCRRAVWWTPLPGRPGMVSALLYRSGGCAVIDTPL